MCSSIKCNKRKWILARNYFILKLIYRVIALHGMDDVHIFLRILINKLLLCLLSKMYASFVASILECIHIAEADIIIYQYLFRLQLFKIKLIKLLTKYS